MDVRYMFCACIALMIGYGFGQANPDKTPKELVSVRVVSVSNPGNYLQEYTILERKDNHERIKMEGDFGKVGEEFQIDMSE